MSVLVFAFDIYPRFSFTCVCFCVALLKVFLRSFVLTPRAFFWQFSRWIRWTLFDVSLSFGYFFDFSLAILHNNLFDAHWPNSGFILVRSMYGCMASIYLLLLILVFFNWFSLFDVSLGFGYFFDFSLAIRHNNLFDAHWSISCFILVRSMYGCTVLIHLLLLILVVFNRFSHDVFLAFGYFLPFLWLYGTTFHSILIGWFLDSIQFLLCMASRRWFMFCCSF